MFPLGHPAWSPSINLTLHPRRLPCLLLRLNNAGGCAGAGRPLAQWGGHRAGCRGSPARRVSMGENERERRGSTAPAGHVPTEKGWVGRAHSLHGDHAQGGWGEQRQVRGAGSIHPQPGRSHSSINSIMHRPRGWWCRAGCGPASPGEQHPRARWGRSKGRRHSPQEQGASRHLLPASPQGQGVLGVLPACTAQLIDGV